MIRLRKSPPRRKRDEQNLQIMVIQYLRVRYATALFTISPQGMKLPMMVAVNLKRMGYRRGTPDIMIFSPRGKYHGLFIELKKDVKQKPTKEQMDFILEARKIDYYACVCGDFISARETIDNYMRGAK